MNRRRFLQASAWGTCQAIASGAVAAEKNAAAPAPLWERICLFTDHLDDFGYSYQDIAKMLAQLSITGPDLTVRPGGLVAPERVADELPQAAKAFRDQGLTVPMISTGLTSARDPAARPTLTAMQRLGIRYYKLGYYAYGDVRQWQAQLETARREVASLVELNRELGVQAGWHNHAGPSIGGALWDSWEVLAPLDPAAVGFYFDPAQASIEGGKHAWRLNFQRLAPRLTMVAIKDFVWEKVDAAWRTRWVPLGEGMVDWPAFFQYLQASDFAGPLSLHIEYDPGGDSKLDRFDRSLAAAQRDLAFLTNQIRQAGLSP